MDVKVGMRAELLQTELSLRQIQDLKPGTIIPFEMPKDLLVYVEELPTFRAKLGRTKEKVALKITKKLKRPESMKTELSLYRKGKLVDSSVVSNDEILDTDDDD